MMVSDTMNIWYVLFKFDMMVSDTMNIWYVLLQKLTSGFRWQAGNTLPHAVQAVTRYTLTGPFILSRLQ